MFSSMTTLLICCLFSAGIDLLELVLLMTTILLDTTLLELLSDLSTISSFSLKGKQLIEVNSYLGFVPITFMQLVYFIKLQRFDGNFYMWRREASFSTFFNEASLEWIEDNLWECFFVGVSSFLLFRSLLKAFIFLMILTILINRMSLIVLVPSLAALEALESWEIFIALSPEPVKYWETQVKSKAIVAVLMMSSQK